MHVTERSGVRVADDFLPDHLFEQLRSYARQLEFGPITSPSDDTEYPDISIEVPVWVKAWVKSGLAKMMGCYVGQVKVDTQFWRLTRKTTPPAPHGAHNDAIHGGYSAFYYVNDKPAHVSQAGTSLLSHKQTGLNRQPRDEGEWRLWERDTNEYDAWHIDELIEWVPNRLAVYEADRMHRAEPPGGWGNSGQDGRLVLITFFSC